VTDITQAEELRCSPPRLALLAGAVTLLSSRLIFSPIPFFGCLITAWPQEDENAYWRAPCYPTGRTQCRVAQYPKERMV